MLQKIVLFPGSFDPYTIGHHDLVLRSLTLFDRIIIGIGKNSQKQRTFEEGWVIDKLHKLYQPFPQISVEVYEGLTAEFAKSKQAHFILRGLRNTIDFEYENPIANGNKFVYPELETVFLITKPEFSMVSSTIVRDLYRYGKDISQFLPFKE